MSKIFDFINGHEKSEQALRESRTAELLRIAVKKDNTPTYQKLLASNKVLRLEKHLSEIFISTPTRSYGVFFLLFGLFTMLLHFSEYYLSPKVVDVFIPLLTGVVCSIISIPMLIAEGPIYKTVRENRFLSYILYDFFCLKRTPPEEGIAHVTKWLIIPVSIGFAVIGFFTSPIYVLAAIGLILFLRLSMSSPELPYLCAFLLLPYLGFLPHASVFLGVLVGIALLSYLRKVLLGNRAFTLEGYDIILGLFLLVIFLSGIFNGGTASFTSSLLMVLLALGYTLSVNLITNRRIADSATAAIGICSFPVSLLAIYQYFFTELSDPWSDASFSEMINGRVTATFGNPNIFAMFLVSAVFFSLYHAIEQKKLVAKITSSLIFLLHLFALTLTFSRGAWIAVGIGLLLFLVIRYVRRPGVLLILASALPYLFFLIPESVLTRLFSTVNLQDSSIAYRLSIFRSSFSMFLDNLPLGVGIGSKTFGEEFQKYAEDAVIAPHSHNIFLEIGCEAGIIALVLFVALLCYRARHLSSYVPYVRTSSTRYVAVLGALTIFSLLLFGLSDYIWSSPISYYLFFAIFGIGGAALRISKREHNDRLAYFGGDSSPESSVADVKVGS